MSHLLEVEEGAEPAGGLQGSAPAGVLTALTGLRVQWGGISGGPEPVTHPSCLSLLKGVWGVSSPVTKGRALTVTPTPTPQGSSLETWHPAGGLVMWRCLPSPSKMPGPRRLSMNLVVSANSTGAGASS